MRGWVAISVTATPAAAPRRIREVLRIIIRDPSGLRYGPPWAWIDGNPVLAELHVKYGLVCTARFGNGRLGSAAHHCDGLARYHELPQVNGYPFHPSEQDMISAAGIKDQELAIIAEGAGVNHPSIAWGRDLAPRAGGDRYALFGTAEAVRGAKFLDSGAVDRQRQHSLGRSKGDGRAQPPRILERGKVRPAARRLAVLARARGRPRRAGGGVETPFELDDQLIEVFRLTRQLRGALAFTAERLFRLRQAFLTLVDEQGQTLALVRQHEQIPGKTVALGGNLLAQAYELGEVGRQHLGLLSHLRQDCAQQHRGAHRLERVFGRDQEAGRRLPADPLQCRQHLRDHAAPLLQ